MIDRKPISTSSPSSALPDTVRITSDGRQTSLLLLLVCLVQLMWPLRAGAVELEHVEEIIDESRLTFARMVGHPHLGWFRDHVRNARAIFIVPRLTRASYLFGGAWGTGVLLVRNQSDNGWSEPAFYSVLGASFGLQIGALTSEIVAVTTSHDGASEMADGVFTLGLDGIVAIGRMGGGVKGSLDVASGAGYIALSTNEGFFAGLAMESTLVFVRSGANETYYGRPVELADLRERRALQWYSKRLKKAVAQATAETGSTRNDGHADNLDGRVLGHARLCLRPYDRAFV